MNYSEATRVPVGTKLKMGKVEVVRSMKGRIHDFEDMDGNPVKVDKSLTFTLATEKKAPAKKPAAKKPATKKPAAKKATTKKPGAKRGPGRPKKAK
jgi:hypothetical protein